MVVKVDHLYYGKTELRVEKVIAICPDQHLLLFEDVKWKLSAEDFDKVAKEWRKLYEDSRTD